MDEEKSTGSWSDRAGFYPDDAWLARGQREEIIDAGLPIVDAHHHLWYRDQHRYLLDEYAIDLATGHNIIASVCVEGRTMYRKAGDQALRSLGETQFFTGTAAASESGLYGPARACAGIVSFVDLTAGARVQALLEAHARAGGGRLRGIRHAAAWDSCPEIGNSHTNPGPNLLSSEQFRRGFSHLAGLDLSFDAWIYHPQIPELISLANDYPETSIVLDHMGGPLGRGPYADRRCEVFRQWRSNIRKLARCPNTVVKLGGLAMRRMALHDFSEREIPPTSEQLAAAWSPYIETCIEAFGVDRCMFESNFPVDKVSCSYPVLWNAFKRVVWGASMSEKNLLFSETARRIYRLDL